MAWAAGAGYGRYVGDTSVKGSAAIDWDDPAARQRFLGELVADADRLLEQARVARGTLVAQHPAQESPADTALVTAAGLLSRVLCQDVDRRETGPAIRQGTAPDRLVPLHDSEMRHGRKSARKRFDGHKGAAAADTDEQLITAVDVLAGNAPDDAAALALVEHTEEATDCAGEETDGDCAYGAGETRQAFAAAGRTLHAKVPALTNGGRFPKTAFALDLDAGTCTCPGGPTTSDLRRISGGQQGFFFPTAVCAACPLRPQGVAGQGGRTIAVHPQESLLQQARAFQASTAFAEVRRRRQAVEHRLARLVQLGMRQARYVGRAKTLLQLAMGAAVANLTLLAGWDLAGAGLPGALPAIWTGLVALISAAWAACAVLRRPPAVHRRRRRRAAPPTPRRGLPATAVSTGRFPAGLLNQSHDGTRILARSRAAGA